jgi:hypothetical protein
MGGAVNSRLISASTMEYRIYCASKFPFQTPIRTQIQTPKFRTPIFQTQPFQTQIQTQIQTPKFQTPRVPGSTPSFSAVYLGAVWSRLSVILGVIWEMFEGYLGHCLRTHMGISLSLARTVLRVVLRWCKKEATGAKALCMAQ